MRLIRIIAVGLFAAVAGSASAADKFDEIKAQLRQSECVEIQFLSILESQIFERTDTARGTAYLAKDGRFRVTVGQDRFLRTDSQLFSFSSANNQVVIQNIDSAQAVSSEVAYILRLDDWFKTRILRPDHDYFLVRTGPRGSAIPDSMTVTIDSKQLRISRIAYYDINDELVTIVLLKESHHATCSDDRFTPDFPKSADRVKL